MRSLSVEIFVWNFCKVVSVSLRELDFFFSVPVNRGFYREIPAPTPSHVPLATNPSQIHFCSSEVQGEGEIYSLKLYPTSSIFIFPLPLQASFGSPQQIPADRAKWKFDSALLIASLQSKTIPTRGGFFPFAPRILIENHNEKSSLGLPSIFW